VRLLRKPSIFPTCVKVGIPAQGLSRHHLWRRWAECACIVSGKVGVEVKPDTSFSEACPQRQSRVPLVIKIYKVNPCNIGDWAQVADACKYCPGWVFCVSHASFQNYVRSRLTSWFYLITRLTLFMEPWMESCFIVWGEENDYRLGYFQASFDYLQGLMCFGM